VDSDREQRCSLVVRASGEEGNMCEL